MKSTDYKRRLVRKHGLLLVLWALLLTPIARADLDGHGPDAWQVTGVAADDVLNARMGPSTDYTVIATFAPDESGLQQVTCVPLLTQSIWSALSAAEREALPQRWCLMRSEDLTRAGWVAARYLMEDLGNDRPPAAGSAAQTEDNDQAGVHCQAPTLTAGTAATAEELLARVRRDEDRFVQTEGFEPVTVLATARADYYSPERFPRVGESALNPDSDLGSIARAMLLFDHLEGIISHPRYRITYHLKHRSDDCDIIPRAYIEITRFNLGQARYEEVIKYVDKQHRPPRAIFEPGPHVSLRFAIGPIQGMYADVKQASRRTLSDAEAQAADCLGQPCLALQDARGPDGDWETVAGQPTQAADYSEPAYDWAPGPARVAEALFIQANDGSALNPREVSEATSFEHPDMTMVISRNVQGQDNNIHGLLHWQGFMDDAISGLWLRMTALPGSEPQWQKHLVYARGGY